MESNLSLFLSVTSNSSPNPRLRHPEIPNSTRPSHHWDSPATLHTPTYPCLGALFIQTLSLRGLICGELGWPSHFPPLTLFVYTEYGAHRRLDIRLSETFPRPKAHFYLILLPLLRYSSVGTGQMLLTRIPLFLLSLFSTSTSIEKIDSDYPE